MKGFFYRAKQGAKLYKNCHTAAYSAQAAFFWVVSLVPFAAFGAALMSAVLPRDRVAQLLMLVFSRQAGGYLVQLMQADTAKAAKLSMVFTIWSATNGIRALAEGIALIYGTKCGIVRQVVLSVVFAPVIMAVAVVSAAVGIVTAHRLWWLGRIVAFVLQSGVLTLCYAIFSCRRRFAAHIAGGCFAAAGWQVFSFGYGVYIKYFSAYPALYGWLGGVMLFMLWLYMCMNIVLCGGLVNVMMEKQGGRPFE